MSNLSLKLKSRIGDFLLDLQLDAEIGITAISGPSASGKSSLLNCIAGLRKADEGKICFGSQTLFCSEQAINLAPGARRCGYLMQKPALFPHMSVAENICFGIDRLAKATQEKKLAYLLELIRMPEMGKRRISELSGGQAQRVALARALALEPSILLLDEPFSALDQDLKEELSRELLRMTRDLSLLVLLVTHSFSEALSIADKLILLDSGKVKAVGAPAELRALSGPGSGSAEFSGYSW